MGHVNNAAYLDYLEEALLAAGEPGRRIAGGACRAGSGWSTSAAASPGDSLIGRRLAGGRRRADDGWAWRLADDGGRELARGQVIRRRLSGGARPARRYVGPAGTSGP